MSDDLCVMDETECKNVFEKAITTGNSTLKMIGLRLDRYDVNRSFVGRLRLRWFFLFSFTCINLDITGQCTWLIRHLLTAKSEIADVTDLFPCLIITLMGSVKSYYFLKYAHFVNKVIFVLNKLHNRRLNNEDEFEPKSVHFLTTTNKIITCAAAICLIAFGLWPLIMMTSIYYSTGEVKLLFPFLFYYPFNAYDMRVWPFLYIQQLWSVVVVFCSVWGPDYVCYALITFTIVQFFYLKEDITSLIQIQHSGKLYATTKETRLLITQIIECHNLLMGCIDLIESTYSKTILVSVVGSSILICFTGFNITVRKFELKDGETIDAIFKIAGFTAFLAIVLGQIFLLCYFGDKIIQSSMAVREAVYNCQWYYADAAIVKDLIIIALRLYMNDLIEELRSTKVGCHIGSTCMNDFSYGDDLRPLIKGQRKLLSICECYAYLHCSEASKPCKLTAYGYSGINLVTFSKILNTSWSYFALLKTVYQNKT